MLEFTLAAWNVHMGLHNDGGRNDIAAKCVELDADVLILLEAWWYGEHQSTLVQQVAEATGGDLFSYTSPGPVPRHPARWTVAIISRLKAQRLDDLELRSIDILEPKLVRIKLVDSGLTLAAAHLDGIHALMRRPSLWRQQRRDFSRHVAAHDIVAGDLNMWAPMVNRDGRPLTNVVKGPTWPAGRPHSQIDHILVSDRVTCVSSEVLPDMGSDHLAVRARLRTQ